MKKNKTIIRALAAAVAVSFSVMGMTGIVSDKKVPVAEASTGLNLSGTTISCYPYTDSNFSVYNNTSSGRVSIGTCYGRSDLISIRGVGTDGWCCISYPTSRGSKTGYCQSSCLFANQDFSGSTGLMQSSMTVYTKSNCNAKFGTVAKNDRIFILGYAGGNTQILYPCSSYYKAGFIKGSYVISNGRVVSNASENIPDGVYKIVSAIDSNYVWDISGASTVDGANLQLYQDNGTDAQIYIVKRQPDGYYTVVNKKSGKAVDCAYAGKTSGTNLWQYEVNNSSAQKWKIISTGDGYYTLINQCNSLAADVAGGVAGNARNIQMYAPNATKAQKFRLVKIQEQSQWQWPVSNSYVCGNGWSQYYRAKGNDHLGMDIKSKSGDTAIYAAADGIVDTTGWNSANGNSIVIKHTISGKTVYSFYAHLSSVKVTSGQNVSKGQQIGVIGNTGKGSTGTHLHFAITTQHSTGTWGYGTRFDDNSNTASYGGYTFYNPSYVIANGKLP